MTDNEMMKMIREEIQNIKNDVTKLYCIIAGNGKLGLCAEVQRLKEIQKEMLKQPDNFGKWMVRLFTIIAAICATGTFILLLKEKL